MKDKFPFAQIFNKPQKISGYKFTILAKLNNLDYSRLAIIIAKRNIKMAVTRNRLRRIIKESFRLHKQKIIGWDIIVIGYKGLDELSNKEIYKCLEKKWGQLSHCPAK